jgi:hypothetical protein
MYAEVMADSAIVSAHSIYYARVAITREQLRQFK